VIEISGGKNEIFAAQDPALIKLVAIFLINNDQDTDYIKLRTYLTEREKPDWPRNLLGARAWYVLAVYRLKKSKLNRAKSDADNSLSHYETLQNTDTVELVLARITAGVSRIAGGNRSKDDILEAFDLFDRSTLLFPPQKSIEEFHPLLATIIAWRSVTRNAVSSDGRKFGNQPDIGSRIKGKRLHLRADQVIRWENDYSNCEVIWKSKRKSPKYSTVDANRGYFGSVLIGFHIDQNNKISDIKVLAEVPSRSTFAEASVRAVKKWKIKEVQGGDECRQNRLVEFNFILRI